MWDSLSQGLGICPLHGGNLPTPAPQNPQDLTQSQENIASSVNTKMDDFTQDISSKDMPYRRVEAERSPNC